MPALTATSALVGAVVLLGLWSGRRWGRRRKRVLDAKTHGLHRNHTRIQPTLKAPKSPSMYSNHCR